MSLQQTKNKLAPSPLLGLSKVILPRLIMIGPPSHLKLFDKKNATSMADQISELNILRRHMFAYNGSHQQYKFNCLILDLPLL